MRKEDNIFICYTYLHCLLSLAIIKKKQIKAEVFFISKHKNETNNIAILDLLEYGINVRFVKKSLGCNYINALIWVFRKKAKNIYVGNLKTSFSRFFLIFLSKYELYTFDDGIGNIIHSDKSYLYNDKESVWSNLIFNMFHKALLYRNIRSRISAHYTIFKQDNIYKNASYIELFPIEKENAQIENYHNSANILLGSSFSEYGILSKKNELKMLNTAIKTFNIDFLIPHPKSTISSLYLSCEIKKEFGIAELEIIKLIEKTGMSINLYAFGSTTLTILENHPKITCFNIVCDNYVYTDFEIFKNFKVKSVKLDGEFQ